MPWHGGSGGGQSSTGELVNVAMKYRVRAGLERDMERCVEHHAANIQNDSPGAGVDHDEIDSNVRARIEDKVQGLDPFPGKAQCLAAHAIGVASPLYDCAGDATAREAVAAAVPVTMVNAATRTAVRSRCPTGRRPTGRK